MDESWARKTGQGDRATIRCGRPRRELAGEVEDRILDAAEKVFLARGFEGASIDEIAEKARAGKPTIYARFSGKEALFAAVVARKARKNTSSDDLQCEGSTTEQRLQALATAVLERTLAPETIGLIRLTVAEARRFPDLASNAHRAARARCVESVAAVLSDIGKSAEMDALPAFAADRLPETAGRFADIIYFPIAWRLLFGEDPAAVRAEIEPHVREAVTFFLAACSYAPPTSDGVDPLTSESALGRNEVEDVRLK
jgi:AcrR family transcriptional regulator